MKKKTPAIDLPAEGTKILLHACCAPCSGAIVEYLVQSGLRPTLFYSNSNIFPLEEYSKRLEECRRYAAHWGIDFVEDEYCHEEWLAAVSGLEREPERGERCTQCFRFRLSRAAVYAREHGFDLVTTSLASSRWKDLDQVNACGLWACAQVEGGAAFWAQNWRKGGLQERRNQIIKEQDFYNQLWCGCEFSHRD